MDASRPNYHDFQVDLVHGLAQSAPRGAKLLRDQAPLAVRFEVAQLRVQLDVCDLEHFVEREARLDRERVAGEVLVSLERRETPQLASREAIGIGAQRKLRLLARRRLAVQQLAEALVEDVEHAAVHRGFEFHGAGEDVFFAVLLHAGRERIDLGLLVRELEHGDLAGCFVGVTQSDPDQLYRY